MQHREQANGNFGLHIGKFFLDQLIRRQRFAKLFAVHGVLARGMPTCFGSAMAPQQMEKRALFRQPNGPFKPDTPGSRFSSGTKTWSMVISPV